MPSLGLALLAAACAASPDGVDDELAHNREKWRSQRITDYRVRFRLICFCAAPTTDPVVLTVRAGALTSVTRESDGEPVDASQWAGRYYTVDAMFDLIAESKAKGAHEVRVSYDGSLGYPRQVFIDRDFRVADEELRFELADLTPLR